VNSQFTVERFGCYGSSGQPDPPHQPLYLNFVLRILRAQSINRVLDAGCGDGNFAVSLAAAGFQVFGIDSSQRLIAEAKARRANVLFICGTLYDELAAPFKIDAFDAVVSVEVIEHLYDPDEFARRAFAALRPGGLLIVTTPYWGYLKNVLLAVTNRMDRALTALWPGGHIKHWSFRTLRILLERNGFEYVAFYGAGRRIPYCWMGMLMVVRKPTDDHLL
jgi:2-polyprenyl-3-methyl-5-hydroxy-6-metoxy-1,4-benzoquinol methylase